MRIVMSTLNLTDSADNKAWFGDALRLGGSVCALCGRRVSLSQPKSKERKRLDHATASLLQTECRQGMYSSWKCKGAPTSRSILFKISRPIIIWNMAEVKSRWVALLLAQTTGSPELRTHLHPVLTDENKRIDNLHSFLFFYQSITTQLWNHVDGTGRKLSPGGFEVSLQAVHLIALLCITVGTITYLGGSLPVTTSPAECMTP